MIEFISRLPQGYQEVEYIESSGTQYIVVDFIPNQDTRLDMLVEPRSVIAAESGVGFIPYGSAESYSSKAFECYTNATGKLEFNYGSQYQTDLANVSVGTKINISHNKNNIVVTNTHGQTIASHSFNYTAFTCPRNLALFATNRSTALAGRTRIYSCQIYNDTTLMFDFVPCYRKSDNVAGLYDFVNGAFYTNAGSGVFAVGSNTGEIVITPGGVIPLKAALQRRMMMMRKQTCLPSGYTQVDYIQGTGSQYIDTGFLVNKPDNYTLEIDAQFNASSSKAFQGANGYMQMYIIAKYGIRSDGASVGDRDLIVIGYANNIETLTINGVVQETHDWTTEHSGVDEKLGVFRMGATNNSWFSGTIATGKLYGYKVWKNNSLVSECVPCVRNSDNVAGVYDIIREQFITNAGSGVFKFPVILPFGLKYSGDAEHTINDNKHIVKLLSSGILTVKGSITSEVYMLAGGGGAACSSSGNGGGTGGGGGNKVFTYTIVAGQYDITVGKGGNSVRASNGTYAGTGGDTSAFGETVTGGTGGMCGTSSGATGAAGRGGTPNGGNGRHPLYGTIEGGSPNGGGMSAWEPQSGGDGYITITIPI